MKSLDANFAYEMTQFFQEHYDKNELGLVYTEEKLDSRPLELKVIKVEINEFDPQGNPACISYVFRLPIKRHWGVRAIQKLEPNFFERIMEKLKESLSEDSIEHNIFLILDITDKDDRYGGFTRKFNLSEIIGGSMLDGYIIENNKFQFLPGLRSDLFMTSIREKEHVQIKKFWKNSNKFYAKMEESEHIVCRRNNDEFTLYFKGKPYSCLFSSENLFDYNVIVSSVEKGQSFRYSLIEDDWFEKLMSFFDKEEKENDLYFMLNPNEMKEKKFFYYYRTSDMVRKEFLPVNQKEEDQLPFERIPAFNLNDYGLVEKGRMNIKGIEALKQVIQSPEKMERFFHEANCQLFYQKRNRVDYVNHLTWTTTADGLLVHIIYSKKYENVVFYFVLMREEHLVNREVIILKQDELADFFEISRQKQQVEVHNDVYQLASIIE